jgi:trans-aconitate 2-methyltransferase
VPPADSWDPPQYERFRNERELPFHDLLALIEPPTRDRAVLTAVDLGCGTGALTVLLHRRLMALAPGARVSTTGLDSSAAMLAQAVVNAGDANADGVSLELGSIEDFAAECDGARAGSCDVVFSNAALHWVDDHPRLLAQLVRGLAPGGQLAVQVPANFDHPSQVAADETARQEQFALALGGYVRGVRVLPPERYSALLQELGFARQHVRLQVYGHTLPSRDDVVEWTRGSLLTDYERRLDADTFAQFLDAYRDRLLPQLADTRPFFYTFKRILLWGMKP